MCKIVRVIFNNSWGFHNFCLPRRSHITSGLSFHSSHSKIYELGENSVPNCVSEIILNNYNSINHKCHQYIEFTLIYFNPRIIRRNSLKDVISCSAKYEHHQSARAAAVEVISCLVHCYLSLCFYTIYCY